MKFALITTSQPMLVCAVAKTKEDIEKVMHDYPLTQLGAVEDDVDIGSEVAPLNQAVCFVRST